jgi:hypothetical protein
VTADASYSLIGDYFSRDHTLNHADSRMTLVADGEILPQSLYIDLHAFAAPTYISRIGAITAGGQPVSNLNSRDTYGYSVRPEYFQRFDDFATSDLSVSQQGVFFVSPHTSNSGPLVPDVVNNSLVTTASEKIASGSSFSRVQWSIAGSYTEMSQSTQSQKQAEGVGQLSFALSRILTLFVNGGYDKYVSSKPLTADINGPIAIGGVKGTYGQTFELVVEAGVQHGFSTYQGSLRWNISPRNTLLGSAADSVGTPQSGVLGNLGNIAASSTGAFYNSQTDLPDTRPQSSLPFSPGPSPTSLDSLALDNSINRVRTYSLSAVHQEERTNYNLGFFGTIRDRLDIVLPAIANTRSADYGVSATIGRKLRTDLSADVNVSYSRADEFSGHDRLLAAGLEMSYIYSEPSSFFVRARYLNRQSKGIVGIVNVPLSSAEIAIGVQHRF